MKKSSITHDGSMMIGKFTYYFEWLMFYGHVGKYTNPMDPSWVREFSNFHFLRVQQLNMTKDF